MNSKLFSFKFLCLLMLFVGVCSCSDNDDDFSWQEGSKVELPRLRAFILNEGSYQMNNATITFFDPLHKTNNIDDIYLVQNEKHLGDTGQDIIEYDDNIYVSVYGSNYVAKLNGAGVEQCRFVPSAELGQPRYLAAEDGKIYVTLYGGYVARLNAETLQLEKTVKVGNNPEYITEENDKLYCVNSGWGKDNRLSIIDIKTFDTAEQVEIFGNPDKVISCENHIYLQGYGGDYPNYTYPVAVYNTEKKTFETIGKGTHIAAFDDMLYVINSETDWSTMTTKNTFYSYNTTNKSVINNSFLNNIPEELNSASIYMFNINEDTGEFYIGTSKFKDGNGEIYRFKANGSFVEKFVSGGQSPRKIVFAD